MLSRLFIVFALLTITLGNSWAHDYSVSQLQIEHPWSRALPPNAAVGAAYFSIENKGTEDDSLVAASSPAAEKIEIHTIVHSGEVMKMQQLDSVAVDAETKTTFAPGATHLMLFGLKQPLVAGERFALTLEFAKAGKVAIEVAVENQIPEDHSGL